MRRPLLTNEFFAGRSAAQECQGGGVGITMFTDLDFRGKSATFRQDVPDQEPLGINDKVSSLRVAPGEPWEVWSIRITRVGASSFLERKWR